jgi:hypothetical protein
MELSETTLQILKNLAGINQNIVIKPGEPLETLADARNVFVQYDLTEKFDQEFGIYDLNEFLNVLSLVDKPRLKFSPESVMVMDSTGRSKVKYFFTDPENLTHPTKKPKMPSEDVRFTLDNDTLNRVKKAAGALGHSEMVVSGNETSVTLTVKSTDNPTSNTFDIDVEGSSNVGKYNFIFHIPNLRIMAGDYEVSISSKLISQFTHKSMPLKYWIALEKNSTYGE